MLNFRSLRWGRERLRFGIVKSGAEALESLQNKSFANLPDLILLDLSLPGFSGHEVLKCIKDDPSLRHMVVVVVTSSQAEADILAAYRSYASAFVTKPKDASGFDEFVATIESFYVRQVKYPRAS